MDEGEDQEEDEDENYGDEDEYDDFEETLMPIMSLLRLKISAQLLMSSFSLNKSWRDFKEKT